MPQRSVIPGSKNAASGGKKRSDPGGKKEKEAFIKIVFFLSVLVVV